MATRQKTRNVSYRRNRDYTASFSWTHELNTDVLRCYTTAREDPKTGYMGRMKTLWDEMHPELNHFTTKQLRQQATFVEKKRATEGVDPPPPPLPPPPTVTEPEGNATADNETPSEETAENEPIEEETLEG